MAPSGPFLTWSPILLPPWGLYPALYPAALRSALPGLVNEERFGVFVHKNNEMFSDLGIVQKAIFSALKSLFRCYAITKSVSVSTEYISFYLNSTGLA